MLELSPTDIALINRVNDLLHQVGTRGQEMHYNFAHLSLGGRIGAQAWGTVNYGIANKAYCGEIQFANLEECCAQLEKVVSWAAQGRRP